MAQFNYQIYQFLFTYFKSHISRFIIILVATVILGSIEPGFAYLIKVIVDEGFTTQQSWYIGYLPIGFIFLFLIRGGLTFLTSYWIGCMGSLIVGSLRYDLFNTFIHLPLAEFEKYNVGNVITLQSKNLDDIKSSIIDVILNGMKDLLIASGLIVYLFYIDWKLMLVSVILCPFIIISTRLFSKKIKDTTKESAKNSAILIDQISDTYKGINTIKLSNLETFFLNKFKISNHTFINSQKKEIRALSIHSPFTNLMAALIFASISYIILNKIDFAMTSKSTGNFISFITAWTLLLRPLKGLSTFSASLQKGLASAELVLKLFHLPQEILPISNQLPTAKVQEPNKLSFNQVGFTYASSGFQLQNIDFKVEKGQILVITGSSGSGKSSLAHLLSRLYDIDSGSIEIDDTDIRNIPLRQLRQMISYVGHKAIIFQASIKENIMLDQEKTEDQLLDACRKANALEFIQQFPKGMDTLVGGLDNNLSDGQRQRLILARAYLRDAPILILDEHTSALDFGNKTDILNAYAKLSSEKITLVIAHSTDMVERSHLIVFLEQGAVIAIGTHECLLKTSADYQKWFMSQVSS